MITGYSASLAVLTFVGFGIVSRSFLPFPVAAPAQVSTPQQDRQALIALEDEWLRAEHDAAALDRILAPDFIHPVAPGDFLNKAQHIYYSTKYLPPGNLKQRFDNLQVRQ
jgi:hypothetical protein